MTYSPFPPDTPATDAPPVVTLRQLWWLPAGWVALGLLFSMQVWLSGFMSFSDNLRIALMRLGPWVVVAPAAVWLCLHFPIAGPQWRRSLLVHIVASIIAIISLDSPMNFMDFPRLGGGPRFMLREKGGPGREPANSVVLLDDPAFGGISVLGRSVPGPQPTIANERAKEAPPPPEFKGEDSKHDVPFERGSHKISGPFDPRGERFAIPGPLPWFSRGRSLPLYACLIAIAHVFYLQRAARRATQAEAQLAAARLAALQLQLQPHFLFNSLNAISSLVRSDAEAADEMICSLGALLHTTLHKSGTAEVSLTEEIEMARHYLRIQQVRFGDALRVESRVDPTALLAAIPTLSIQPLLENAVIHGLNGRAGLIRLHAWRSGERLVVEVTDEVADPQAPGGPPKPSSGVGLANIRARLATLHGARASLDLIRNPTGATARMEVPFREILAS